MSGMKKPHLKEGYIVTINDQLNKKTYRIIVNKFDDDAITVGASDSDSIEFMKTIKRCNGYKIKKITVLTDALGCFRYEKV